MKKRNLTIFFSLLLCAAFLFAACAPAAKTPEVSSTQNQGQQSTVPSESPKDVPIQAGPFGDFSANDLDGKQVTQEIFSNAKLTMVNVWATYCGPCLKEMPELGEINSEYASKGFQVVGIVSDSLDSSGNPVQQQVDLAKEVVQKTGANYTSIIPTAPSLLSVVQSIRGVPFTVFVDAQGNQVGEAYYGARSKDAWMEIIDGLLAGMPEQSSTSNAASTQAASLNAKGQAVDPPDLYMFETTGLDGNTYTDQVLNNGTVLTLAVVWNPAWEGSAEALKKVSSYLSGNTSVNVIGFVMGAEENKQVADDVVGASGTDFPQLLPTDGFSEYILGEKPVVLAIAPWGQIMSNPIPYDASAENWDSWFNSALTDATSGCCG
ncbi:MAG: TlpA disulfide reductase family protein [Christensenella sp.]|nr:TlpA disulfide reductase family protein [Christensenella sp.]